MNPNDRPDYTVASYTRMCPLWKIVEDVEGGTPSIRNARESYLPREEGERPVRYEQRLRWSVFFNAYAKTRDALVGMVFKSDPVLNPDVPPQIQSDAENIDLQGNHIDVFLKELFMEAFDGHAFILVDMQPALGENATLADEQAAGRRPYWVKYEACQALNWRTEIVNGETVLAQITFEEKTNEPAGLYGEDAVTRYRVFKLGNGVVNWELYRKVSGESDPSKQIVLENQGVLTQERIPVAVVYGNRDGYLESTPPLIDLAYLNIDHYQQVSDYRTQLHYLVPGLVRYGVPEADREKLRWGPLNVTDLPNKETSDMRYISHDGKAIEATRQAILDSQQRMAAAGLSMLTAHERGSNQTATEIRANNLQQTSDLATMARSLQDATELALRFHAKYYGLKDGGSIKLGVAQADIVLDGPMITALGNLIGTGITLETFLNIMETGLGGFDAEEEVTKLQQAAVAARAMQPQQPNVPGSPDAPVDGGVQ